MIEQHTLVTKISCAGIGVHSGAFSRMTLLPAPVGHGVRFVRTDLVDSMADIPAFAENVTALTLGTTISNSDGASVATIEHLMAACLGLGLDNVRIEIDGPEVPIMDGSSAVFCNLIQAAGLLNQGQARRLLRVLEPVEIREGEKWARLSPHLGDNLALKARIDFSSQAIGVQEANFCLESGAFGNDVAFARTFGFSQDVVALQARGLAQGGSLDNAVLVDGDRVVNPEGLRCADEFVRHKLLDAIGDLALAGSRIAGFYEANQPGHALNNALLRTLLETPSAWSFTLAQDDLQPVWHKTGSDEVQIAI